MSRTSLFRAVPVWLEHHLSRVTSGGHYIPEVDGIRFLAIMGVMAYHLAGDLHFIRNTYTTSWMTGHGLLVNFIGMGYFGVEIFFVLSGFIVAVPFARHAIQGDAAPDLSRYYLRRLTRIEPPYLIALTMMYLDTRHLRHFFPDFLVSLIYSHRYFFGGENPVAIITWSLEVEVVFYLLAPWLALIYNIPGKYWRWVVQIALLGCYSYFSDNFLPSEVGARLSFASMIQYFLAGMLMADFFVCGLLRHSQKIVWDLPVAAAMGGLFQILKAGEADVWTYHWVLPYLTMLLFVGIMKGRVANWLLCLRPITLIGGMCYTLYLWHCLVAWHAPFWIKVSLAHMSYLRGMMAYCLVFIPTMIIILTPVYLLFERPFMNGPGSRYLERRLTSFGLRLRNVRSEQSGAAA